MRSKTTVYLLIAAVLAIWGVIAWKLFSPSAPVKTAPPRPPAARPAPVGDKNVLYLDYPDPFLKKTDRASAPVRPASGDRAPAPSLPARTKGECRIKYIGYIRRGKTPGYIIEHNGAHHSIKKGETLDSFRLVRVFPDSLVFAKQGFSYTVRRMP